MRAVVQRVSEASVTVDGTVVGAIGTGLCVLVGVAHDDTDRTAARLARRLAALRVLPDAEGDMNRSVLDEAAAILVVSQFTLQGDTSRGNRPSWKAAARAEVAEPLVERVVDELRSRGVRVETGRFGARMALALVNDGPVTVLLEF